MTAQNNPNTHDGRWLLPYKTWIVAYMEAIRAGTPAFEPDWPAYLQKLDLDYRFTQSARQLRYAGRLIVSRNPHLNRRDTTHKAQIFLNGGYLGLRLAHDVLGDDFDTAVATAGNHHLHPLSPLAEVSDGIRAQSMLDVADDGWSRARGAAAFFSGVEPKLDMDIRSQQLLRRGFGLAMYSIAMVYDRTAPGPNIPNTI